MTDKLIMTTAQRNRIVGLLEDGTTGQKEFRKVADMLQSLPMVDSEPFAYYLQERDNVDFIYAHEYSNHEDRMHERDAKVTPLYTSPQALTPITADDVTEAIRQEFLSKDVLDEAIAEAYNAVIKHRGKAK